MTRPPRGNEVERAVAKAFGEGVVTPFSRRLSNCKGEQRAYLNPRNQQVDLKLIDEARKSGFVMEDLPRISPVSLFGRGIARTVIAALFPKNSLICCSLGREYGCKTARLEDFHDLPKYNFIVPNPMKATAGVTQEGKRSPRTLGNTDGWRFFVYESDGLSLDDQAAVLYRLATHHRLVLVVWSGNRSLQGWFHVEDAAEDEIRRFQCLAVRMGCCTGPLSRCQLVRMPGGWNKQTGKDQAVLFFNPDSVKL